MTISTEQFTPVNIGSEANDGTGDTLREAFIILNNNFANISDVGFDAANINCTGSIEVSGNITVGNAYVPSSNSSAGTTGQIVWDSDYIYVCIGTDTWKRANISTW